MAAADELRTAVLSFGDRVIVSVSGEVDFTTVPRLRSALAAALASGSRSVVVDFGAVGFCDCSGARALLWARQRAGESGASLRVTGVVAPVVARLFEVLELEQLLGPRQSC
jgi:anti-anti-sigma factor